MASLTKKTESIRKNHHRSCGKEHRRIRRNKGSTPAFPIHVPEHQNTTPTAQS